MNLRQLEYFLKIAEVGSITKAAPELRMTQPALSRQVRVFEDEMGWKLFERGAKTIELTHAGEVVVREGKKMLNAINQGLMQIKREIDGGVIRIGYAPSLAGKILKIAMSCFLQRHPNVNIQLHDMSTEEMRKGILEGKLDIIIEVPKSGNQIEWMHLSQQCMRVAIPEHHPILDGKKRRKIKVQELENERFLLLSRFEYPDYWQEVSQYFSANSVNVKVAGEFDGIESMSVALDAGLGVAFVSSSSQLPSSVVVAQIDPEPAPIQIAVGWDATRAQDAIVEEFVQELKIAAQR